MLSGHDPSLSRRVHRLRAGGVYRRRRRVIGELGGAETDRVRTALDEEWAKIIDAPSPTDGDAVAASDIARRTIANETDQAEHEVEKTDTILAGLAIQHILRVLINLQTELGVPRARETKTAPKTGRTQITERIHLCDLVEEAKICENPQISREQPLPNR